jgi:hypothetical protein
MQLEGTSEQQLILLDTHWGPPVHLHGPTSRKLQVDSHGELRPTRQATRKISHRPAPSSAVAMRPTARGVVRGHSTFFWTDL